jgi:NADH-quinone oxidoreductase subunit E
MGETTSDGMFTVKEAECLAACDMAPMMIIGEDYIGPLTVEKVDKIIDEWRAANGG